MIVVALTGNYGMGKSSVTSLFRKCGACTLDSDAIVAGLLQKKSVIEKMRVLLGPEVLNADKSLNKSLVADIIFHNRSARKRLESLLHPLVFQAMEASIKKLKAGTIAPPLRGGDKGEGGLCGLTNDGLGNRVVIVEVPLLFEGSFQKRFDRTIAVYTSQKVALARLKKKGIARKDALARLHAQMDIRQKKRLADYSIDNHGTKAQTMTQVRKIYKALIEEKAQ